MTRGEHWRLPQVSWLLDDISPHTEDWVLVELMGGRGGAFPPGSRRCPTFPLFTFSAQALTYMGMAMTTSSQACTVPAFQWDMGVVLTSSTCCSRSTCSSPSDRLRLCLVGLHWLSESATHKRTGPCDGVGHADCDPESALPGCRLASPPPCISSF